VSPVTVAGDVVESIDEVAGGFAGRPG